MVLMDSFELAISETIADASHHQDDITVLVDSPYKPLFATATGGGGVDPNHIYEKTCTV